MKQIVLTTISLIGLVASSNVAVARLPQTSSIDLLAHGMGEMTGGTMAGEKTHAHGSLEVPAGQPVPAVKLIIHPDAMGGWNLEVQVTNFTFAPKRVNTASNSREGHAHLYIDGRKVTRLYGSWYYLAALPPGKHQIRVTLNANGHEELVHQGQPIAAIATIQVPPKP